MTPASETHAAASLPKAPTGIAGLDEITSGGLPKGRPTLICGSAGCGKTLLAMQFLVHGATRFGEHGAYITFEETEEELAQNVRSLGFDVDKLVREKKLAFDHIHIEKREIEEAGEYDLEGLFLRLDLAIESVGAKRVVLDTIESLFSGFSNMALLRSELRRLFRRLKDKGVTAVITAERGEGSLTRQGLEEYVSDCVILLVHRVQEQISTRRIRVVKYRGTSHGTNEYPFLINEHGVSVLPFTALALDYGVSLARSVSRAGSPDSTPCWVATAITVDPRFWFQGQPGPARRACPRISPTQRVAGMSAASTSPSKSRRSRSYATCARSASTSRRG